MTAYLTKRHNLCLPLLVLQHWGRLVVFLLRKPAREMPERAFLMRKYFQFSYYNLCKGAF